MAAAAAARDESSVAPESRQIRSYAELQKQLHPDLRPQPPEWIDSNGNSPMCDAYDHV
jgi:hypothetical protein